MKTALVIYYSQSGESAQVARIFADELEASGAKITIEALRPVTDYPYPWRSIRRFFDAMPECVLRQPAQIEALHFDPPTRFDLVVLVYPVWFLTPAPPMQSFFTSSHASTLLNTDVITICVSRAMWQQASEWMKVMLAKAGAIHCDNIVVTHQGSPLLTLISTPRALLFGKRDVFLKIFPQVGVSAADLDRVRELGAVAAERLGTGRSTGTSLLRGERALTVNRWFIAPELLAWYCFSAWAVLIQQFGRMDAVLRGFAVYAFSAFLVGLILIGLPLALLATLLLYPALKHRLDSYSFRLAAPTGEQRMPP